MIVDFRKVWELLASETLKESQLAGDGGSIVSRIIESESKLKIESEYVHVKTNNNEENAIENKVLEMVSKRDTKAKEERIRCIRENRIENTSVVGNVSLQSEKEIP